MDNLIYNYWLVAGCTVIEMLARMRGVRSDWPGWPGWPGWPTRLACALQHISVRHGIEAASIACLWRLDWERQGGEEWANGGGRSGGAVIGMEVTAGGRKGGRAIGSGGSDLSYGLLTGNLSIRP